MATQDQPLTVEGWQFQLVNDQLSITSQSNPATQVKLSPQGAFALLGYLSQYRDDLYWATHQGARDESEHYLSERLTDGEAAEQ
jgi:hypothetical protein